MKTECGAYGFEESESYIIVRGWFRISETAVWHYSTVMPQDRLTGKLGYVRAAETHSRAALGFSSGDSLPGSGWREDRPL
jgi:hypothetical protein